MTPTSDKHPQKELVRLRESRGTNVGTRRCGHTMCVHDIEARCAIELIERTIVWIASPGDTLNM